LPAPGADTYPVAHFSWVPRSAPVRAEKTGTTDAQWLENDHPFYPADFDEAYFQGAAPEQQISPHLKPGYFMKTGNPAAGFCGKTIH